jgi:hypothetical protein
VCLEAPPVFAKALRELDECDVEATPPYEQIKYILK